jgi:hypothetical protein
MRESDMCKICKRLYPQNSAPWTHSPFAEGKYRSTLAHSQCRRLPSEYSPFVRYSVAMGKWCTVTVMDGEGKRYSLDVSADSSYDAAHLYLTHVRGNPSSGFPIPTTSTLFEVVTDGRIHHVQGARLKKWIENRRHEWKGPRGLLFSQRPMIGD